MNQQQAIEETLLTIQSQWSSAVGRSYLNASVLIELIDNDVTDQTSFDSDQMERLFLKALYNLDDDIVTPDVARLVDSAIEKTKLLHALECHGL